MADSADPRILEQALRDSESRYRALTEHAGAGIGFWSPDGRLLMLNERAAASLGGAPGDFVGQNMVELFGANHGAEYQRRLQQALAEGGAQTYEDRVDVGAGPLWYLSTYAAIDIGDGTPGVQVMSTDITAQRLAEEQLRQSHKLEALGQLAGGVAHDINNVLTTVQSLASLMQRELSGDSDLANDAANILRACERGQRLTRNLLGFARQGAVQNRRFCPNRTVRDLLQLARRTLSKGVVLREHLEVELAEIEADPDQLHHALLNLVINGADAMGGRGTLTLTTANTVRVGEMPHPDLAPGQYVEITVSDTGSGMTDEVRQRAFDPFFTTKDKGKGTGLGLSMVYGLAARLGGAVVIDSEVGSGTDVTLFIRAIAPEIERGRGSDSDEMFAPLVQAEGTVLLVDDEELIRISGGRLLRKFGFEVLVAADGVEAVALYRQHRQDIVLVILDVMMPVMDGADTFLALREIDAHPPVLFASGYMRDRLGDDLMALGALGFVQKPYTLEQLSEDVRAALERLSSAEPSTDR